MISEKVIDLASGAWNGLNYYPVKFSGIVTILALLGLWVVYRKVQEYENKLAELALYARVISENTKRREK